MTTKEISIFSNRSHFEWRVQVSDYRLLGASSLILIPLLSTDLTLLLWFPNLKEATKSNQRKQNEINGNKNRKWKKK
jgi:hypothetical protein